MDGGRKGMDGRTPEEISDEYDRDYGRWMDEEFTRETGDWGEFGGVEPGPMTEEQPWMD